MTALDARTLALARVGAERAKRAETRLYAEQAIRGLTRELEELDSVHELIYGELPPTRGKTPAPAVRGSDFDRAFIDALIGSHEEAIRIAEQEVASGEDPDILDLAEKVVTSRTPQISSMRRFREEVLAPASGG